MEDKEIINGTEFPGYIVDAFIKAFKLPPEVFGAEKHNWHYEVIASHLISFHAGWNAGHEIAMEEAPNCDDCDIYDKVAEAGPPESHYSNWDR